MGVNLRKIFEVWSINIYNENSVKYVYRYVETKSKMTKSNIYILDQHLINLII